MSDDDLMIGLQSGARDAFAQLVERYQSPLIGFFFKNTRDRQLAEDLSQETLLRVYNQSWDYLPQGRFRGWLFRIARNLLIDTVRRRTNDALVHSVRPGSDDEVNILTLISDGLLPPEVKAGHRELKAIVDDMLEELPEEQRLTFTMHHYSGLTLSEVADALDTSVATSKSRLRLAREKLQARLARIGLTDPSERQET
ncbi:RNA polymerase sigma factor [Stratiformator vulcanicus]|nr:sigma-70 family RNA polymerase sigma factor [Stratiformator vulcanicus]